MKTRIWRTCLVAAFAVASASARDTPDSALAALDQFLSHPRRPIPNEMLERMQHAIRPQPGESRWAEIPWLTSLTEARRKAAAEGKPLFVWVISDGYPSGIC